MRGDAALLREWVATVRLPPAMRLEVMEDRDKVALRLTGAWQDATAPQGSDARAIVRTASLVDLHHYDVALEMLRMGDDQPLRHTLYREVRRLWDHELHEWLTFDGKHHVDPHPAGGFR